MPEDLLMSQIATEVDLSPDIRDLEIEDDTPVDNLITEKQQRLLTEPLYSQSSVLDCPFLVAANVGMFYAVRQPPIVPDVFLSLEVEVPENWREKKNRTYLVWEFGKPPNVTIEIVSNKEGNELGSKLRDYSRIGVAYYVVFDPLEQLGDTLLRMFELRGNRYQEMTETWLEQVGIGLTLWDGVFEGKHDRWLRWCTRDGVVPTGAEQAEQERQRAEQERQRAERAETRAARLEEQLRAMGIDPDV
jgi:Uma2 family endonuclease